FFFFQAEDGIRDLIVTGVQTCALPIFDTQREQWDAVLSTNLTGTMLTIKHAGRAMVRGGGSIVAISSIAGVLTHRWMTAYCVSRSEERRVGKECRSRRVPYH